MLPAAPSPCSWQLRAAATAVIQRHLARHGHETPFPGLSVCEVTAPVPPTAHVHEPSICLCIRGAREGEVPGPVAQDSGTFLVFALGEPMVVALADASPHEPYVALKLAFDLDIARSVVSTTEAVRRDDAGAATGSIGTALLDAAVRLVLLLEDPAQIPALGALRQRELLHHVLGSEAGGRLRAVVRTATEERGVARAVAWLHAHYIERLRLEKLAALSGMGVSTLHRRFHLVTGRSPLQFQKQLRLHEARRLMLVDRLDAAESAFRVGYESVTQFHREYRRLFGRPPRQDVRALTP